MNYQCQPEIGIDDRKPKVGFHVDHRTSVYFTDWSVNYNRSSNRSAKYTLIM